jgi:hypothetical protein
LVRLLEALFRAFKEMTAHRPLRLQEFLAVVVAVLATAGHGTHSFLAQAALHEKL